MDRSKILPKADVVHREEYLTALASDKTVLNIGMGGFTDNPSYTARLADYAEATLQGKLHSVARNLTGVDVNPHSLAIMSEALPGRYIQADITAADASEVIGGTYELIVLGDVIEHLDCFRSALQNLRALLADDGVLVITTANAYNAEAILKQLFRYESVHEEHTCYFSYLTMKRLLEMNDMTIGDFRYYVQTRAGGSVGSRTGYYAMRGVSAVLPQFSQGIVFHARRRD